MQLQIFLKKFFFSTAEGTHFKGYKYDTLKWIEKDKIYSLQCIPKTKPLSGIPEQGIEGAAYALSEVEHL